MRKIILLFSIVITSAFAFAQAPVIEITSPSGLSSPYTGCLNTAFTLQVDLSAVTDIIYDDGWKTCAEMPDFDGWSNSSLWNSTYIKDSNYTHTLTGEIYIWYTTNVAGGMIGSTPVNSNVIKISLAGDIPEITYSDNVFCDGSTLTVSSSITGLGDGKYKWYKDGVEISNETNETYDISEAGSYQVSALSNETDCPGIYYMGEAVDFSLIKPVVTGSFKADLNRVTLETSMVYASYQWQQASSTTVALESIAGATNYNYNATISANDLYYAVEVVTTDGCTATSDRHLINDSIYTLPEIIEPTSTFVCRDEVVSLKLTSEAYASYQWYKNGSAIYNATNATFDAGANYPGGSGVYTVKVTTPLDADTEIESNAIELTFAVQPSIGIKDDVKLCPGGTATLEAKPGWNGEVGGYDTYQWFFNDVNDITSAVEISEATDSVLDIDVPNETRYYWVKTTLNGCVDESRNKSIIEFSLNAPYISKNPWDGLICEGDTVTLKSYSSDVMFQWYFNGEALEADTLNELKASKVGYYDLQITSTLCPTAEPIMNKDSAVIAYKFSPSFSVVPEGDQYGDNPNHRIFCSGDTISLEVDNASNYAAWQWMGKLYSVNSSSDEWEDVSGATDSIYSFINGQNDKLRYRVRVDSVMANDVVCSAISDYKIIDGHVNQSPAVTSYDNSELCDQGDSTLLHLGFPGDWARMEWYVDGVLVPDSNTDTIYANQEGMWTITCYPNTCPNIPHSSGVGPTVKFMPEAEIWENDTVIWAMPQMGYYYYQWYYNDQPINMDTLDIPSVLYKKDLQVGKYTVEVSNPAECIRTSDPYVIVGVEDELTQAVNIYPNPVKSELNITITDVESARSIEVYNSTGSLVETVNVVNNNTTVSMSNKVNGIYLIKVNYTNKESSIHKVVKQ